MTVRRPPRRIGRGIGIAAVAVVVVAGCSGGGADGPPSSAAGPPATEVPSTIAAPPTTTTSVAPTTTAPPTTTTTMPAFLATGADDPSAAACGISAGYAVPWPERPRYDAALAVDPVAGTVAGTLRVAFTPDAHTDRLVFRLWANGPRPAAAGAHIDVTAVRVDGREPTVRTEAGGAPDGVPGTVLVVDEGGSYAAGRTVTVDMTFLLTLPGPSEDRLAVEGTNIRLGSILPTLSWIRGVGWQTSPAVDIFGEAAASEVADYHVAVTVPEGLAVLATGVETAPGTFDATASRDWSATVGRFDVRRGTAQGGTTEVVVGVGEGGAWDPDQLLATTIAAVDAFSTRFGPYPWPVLTVAATPGLGGGIEFPMHVQFGSDAPLSSLTHEVAHQWFYGLVGNDQYADPWLDEGLTEYAEASEVGAVDRRRGQSIPAAGVGQLGASMERWAADPGAYFRSVYVQGVQALAEMGDTVVGGAAALDCGLARYVHDQAWAVATPIDLVASMEAAGIDARPVLADHGVDPG